MRQYQYPEGIVIHAVHEERDAWFRMGFDALSEYFTSRDEMEAEKVIRDRLKWSPEEFSSNGVSLWYELAVATDVSGKMIGVGDASVVLTHDPVNGKGTAVVHLSHILRTGTGGREFVSCMLDHWGTLAREALLRASLPEDAPITLVGEVEPVDPGGPMDERRRRIDAFLCEGLCIVDPRQVNYYQPDLRSSEQIDAAGGEVPLPLMLMVCRMGLSHESEMVAKEVLHIVECLYEIYSRGIRQGDMYKVRQTLSAYPSPEARIPLLRYF